MRVQARHGAEASPDHPPTRLQPAAPPLSCARSPTGNSLSPRASRPETHSTPGKALAPPPGRMRASCPSSLLKYPGEREGLTPRSRPVRQPPTPASGRPSREERSDERAASHPVGQRPAVGTGDHIVQRHAPHRRAHLQRRGAQMRQQGDVFHRAQRLRHLRLELVDVEAGALRSSLPATPRSAPLVDHVAAGLILTRSRATASRQAHPPPIRWRVSAPPGAATTTISARPAPRPSPSVGGKIHRFVDRFT